MKLQFPYPVPPAKLLLFVACERSAAEAMELETRQTFWAGWLCLRLGYIKVAAKM